MPKPNQRSKSKPRPQRKNLGQFLILSALSIVIIMISFASLLAHASLSRVSLKRTDFREVATEVTMNFRAALAAATAEVSRSLDFEASTSRYAKYTSLDEDPNAMLDGYKFISEWQNNILLQKYPGLGLNFSATQPIFGHASQGLYSSSIEDTIKGSSLMCPKTGSVQSITAYISCSSAAKNMKAAIYNDVTHSFVAQTNEQSVGVGTNGWVTFTFSSPPTLTGGSSYVLVVWSASGNGEAYLYYDVGSTNQGHRQSQTYATNYPSSLGSVSHDTNKYSIYCTYQSIFICEWGSNPGYSMASSNMSLDILAYSFYGWQSETTVQLNVTIMDLVPKETDGKTVAFYFGVLKENGVPVTDLQGDAASFLFQHVGSDEFTLSRNAWLTYLGRGYYLAEFSMYSTTVQEGLNEIKDYANHNMTQEDFYDNHTITEFKNMMDIVSEEYNASMLVEAYGNLTETKDWIVVSNSTTYVLSWIDLVRSQILPTVRIALQDSRGIVVGAVRRFADLLGDPPFHNDTMGPVTRDLYASPNPTNGASTVTLTAWIDDLNTGMSDIASAEYFVDETGANGTGTSLAASDGVFDSPLEQVKKVLNVSGWTLGNHTIYVHGKDEAGNWGGFSSITVSVTGQTQMYVLSIDMYLHEYRFSSWKLHQAEAVVRIVDIHGKPVSGARVYGHWGGPPGNVDGFTDADGKVGFLSEKGWGRKTFTFCVDNVVKDGYVYNPALNKATCKSIKV